jgi:hypothetical protein
VLVVEVTNFQEREQILGLLSGGGVSGFDWGRLQPLLLDRRIVRSLDRLFSSFLSLDMVSASPFILQDSAR